MGYYKQAMIEQMERAENAQNEKECDGCGICFHPDDLSAEDTPSGGEIYVCPICLIERHLNE